MLCNGVSIEELAAREGVTRRRMRAIVQETLARRAPEPPAEFLALQIARLNEAMFVAFGAMANGHLEAVDRVVRIVREYDRCHGFAPRSASARSASRGRAKGAAPAGPARLEMASQGPEKPQFAAGDGEPREAIGPLRAAARAYDLGLARRLEMAPQSLEKPQFAAEKRRAGPKPAETRSPSSS
jgi:hypothetical protein